jgi:CBS domain containing-hemolysin-like protein
LELSPAWALLLGLFLVLLNGFFVAAEFALAKVRLTQVEPLARRGDRRAQVGQKMLRHLDAYLSATQLGITLASIALGWIGEPAFAWLLQPLVAHWPGTSPAVIQSMSLTLSFATVSVLHIVFGELVPKSIAIRKAERTALWTAIPLYAFYWLFFPAIWTLNGIANRILRLLGIQPASAQDLAHSEEEVRLLLSSEATCELPESKRDLLGNVFALSERVARQVMVPRADVVFLSTHRTVEENLYLARSSGHTRFPLCEGDLDHILGIIHIKDLFRAATPITDLTRVARPVRFVPETIRLDHLLARMRAERIHIAAVLDEYGGVSGIVTLENVIEELVGPIQDEFDAERPELVRREDGALWISGSMLVVDLEQELKIEFSSRDADTVGGLVLSALGRRPRVGDRVLLHPLEFEVQEVSGNRIATLLARLVLPSPRGSSGMPDGKTPSK